MSQHGGQFRFDPPPPQALTALLPNYAFECLIAKGGMGAVYKARQISLDRDVAIKILPRELGSDSEFRSSFETEARVMAKLNHANLIGVYDSGSIDGMPFLVMEYIPGQSLYHYAFRRKIEPAETTRLIRGILEGLGHAHEHGIIHRDIKPANILLTTKGEPKIGDFGLARHADAEGPGLVMGTPGYTAPEVLNNPNAADRRSDLFAVGMILYELLTGQAPKDNAPLPSAIAKSPAAFDAIYQRATHPSPSVRYPDARAMLSALETASRSSATAGSASGSVAPTPSKPSKVTKAPNATGPTGATGAPNVTSASAASGVGSGGRALPPNVRPATVARPGTTPRASGAAPARQPGQSVIPNRPPTPGRPPAGQKPAADDDSNPDAKTDAQGEPTKVENPMPGAVTIVEKNAASSRTMFPCSSSRSSSA